MWQPSPLPGQYLASSLADVWYLFQKTHWIGLISWLLTDSSKPNRVGILMPLVSKCFLEDTPGEYWKGVQFKHFNSHHC
jgi:hypothetical protein